MFFVPYNQQADAATRITEALGVDRVQATRGPLARRVPNLLAVDFMLPSPITDVDDNYWDALHYRIRRR